MTRTVHEDERMLVANDSFVKNYNGIDHTFIENVTRVRADDPILEGIRHLFKPITGTFSNVEAASAAPGERRGEQ